MKKVHYVEVSQLVTLRRSMVVKVKGAPNLETAREQAHAAVLKTYPRWTTGMVSTGPIETKPVSFFSIGRVDLKIGG